MSVHRLTYTIVSLTAAFVLFFSTGQVCGAEPGGAPEPGGPGESVRTGQVASDIENDTEKRPLRVTSDTMEADRGSRTVTFRGNVVAEEGVTICSDELSLSYGTGEEITEIKATGNVKILDGTKRASGDRATYDRKAKVVVISGGALASQCTDTVGGEKITFYLDTDDVIIDGGEGGRVRAVIMPEKECGTSVESEEFRCSGSR